jgi:hypothetical protein
LDFRGAAVSGRVGSDRTKVYLCTVRCDDLIWNNENYTVCGALKKRKRKTKTNFVGGFE